MAKKPKQVEETKKKTTNEKRNLKCQLTRDELLVAGDELAQKIDDLKKVKADKIAITKDFNAQESALEADIQRQQLLVRNKWEYMSVDCENTLDYASLECRVVRLDTGEIVIQRAMNQEEKEMTLPFDGESE